MNKGIPYKVACAQVSDSAGDVECFKFNMERLNKLRLTWKFNHKLFKKIDITKLDKDAIFTYEGKVYSLHPKSETNTCIIAELSLQGSSKSVDIAYPKGFGLNKYVFIPWMLLMTMIDIKTGKSSYCHPYTKGRLDKFRLYYVQTYDYNNKDKQFYTRRTDALDNRLLENADLITIKNYLESLSFVENNFGNFSKRVHNIFKE